MRNRLFLFIKSLSIFQKMILSFVAVIVLPGFISFIISNRTTGGLIISQTYRDTLSSVDLAKSNFSGVLNEFIHEGVYISNDDQVQEFLSESDLNKGDISGNGIAMANWLSLLRKVDNVVSNVFYTNRINSYVTLLSKNGKFEYSNYSIDSRIKEYLSKYNTGYLKRLGNIVSFVGIEQDYTQSSNDSSSYVITWIKTVESKKNGNLIGALIISVPVKEITNLMVAESIPVKRMLLDNNMTVIAATQNQWLAKSFYTFYNGKKLENEKGYITYNFDGEGRCILTYDKIKDNGWTIIDIKPISELSGKLQDISVKLLLLNLASILFFLFIAAAIARGISVPLHKLSKTMLETDLNVTSKPNAGTGKDEVQMLEYNFDIMRKNINSLMKKNIETEEKKREAELKALQSQISPHFLFNTLNAVRCAAETGKKEKVSELIIALINLLRMTIVKEEAFITLEQEIETLNNYVKILKARHDIDFEMYFDIPDIIKDYKIPKLLLQPLVENSFFHGFKDLSHKGIIEVIGDLEVDRVIIRISDNGNGLEFNPLKDRKDKIKDRFSGIGVINVDERIKMHYGNQYGVRFISKQGEGTTVEVILPGLAAEEYGDYDKDNDC